MPSIENLPEHPFCTFVTQVQANKHIKNALVSLVQRLQLNTNILLFCCWIGETGRKQFTKKNMQDILSDILPWHNKIVLTLKKMRKSLEDRIRKPSDYTTTKLILEQEITANKIEQLMLTEVSIRPSYPRTDSQKFVDACKNITTYCKELQTGMDQQDTEAIKQLLSLIFPTIDTNQIDTFWGTSFTKTKKYKIPEYSQLELDELL